MEDGIFYLKKWLMFDQNGQFLRKNDYFLSEIDKMVRWTKYLTSKHVFISRDRHEI